MILFVSSLAFAHPFSGRCACRIEDSREFICLIHEPLEPRHGKQLGTRRELEPEPNLIRFLQNNGHLIDEICIRFRPQSRSVIGRN